MRHGDKVNNLSRKKAHRKALLTNLSIQLVEHKRIFTTQAKAKALRVFVEPIITRSKKDNTHNRRVTFDKLQNKKAVAELFDVISPKVIERPGGYTRIIKLPSRFGDGARMAMIELVDFNTIYEKSKGKADKKKTRRSRRGRKKSGTTPKSVQTGDDLTKMEGINGDIAKVLATANITKYADLAQKSEADLKDLLNEADGNYEDVITSNWTKQAEKLANSPKEDKETIEQSSEAAPQDKTNETSESKNVEENKKEEKPAGETKADNTKNSEVNSEKDEDSKKNEETENQSETNEADGKQNNKEEEGKKGDDKK